MNKPSRFYLLLLSILTLLMLSACDQATEKKDTAQKEEQSKEKLLIEKNNAYIKLNNWIMAGITGHTFSDRINEQIKEIDDKLAALDAGDKGEHIGYFILPPVSSLETLIKLTTTALELPGEVALVDETAQTLLTASTTLLPMAQDMDTYNSQKEYLVDGGKKLKEQGVIYRDAMIAVNEACEQFLDAVDVSQFQQKKDRLESYSKDSIQYHALKINLAAQTLLDATTIVETIPIDIPAFDSAVTQFIADVKTYSDFLTTHDPDSKKFGADCKTTQAIYSEMIGSARSLLAAIKKDPNDEYNINDEKRWVFSRYNNLSNGHHPCLF